MLLQRAQAQAQAQASSERQGPQAGRLSASECLAWLAASTTHHPPVVFRHAPQRRRLQQGQGRVFRFRQGSTTLELCQQGGSCRL